MHTLAARPSRPVFAVLLGGSIAATLDMSYACISNAQYGKTPLWVFQSVATGLLGAKAFDGGASAGIIGLAAHFTILIVAAGFYYAGSLRVPLLRAQAILCGASFGVLVYLFMNFVVLPVSAFPYRLAYPPLRLLEGFASHALFVGMPIALCVRRWSQPE